MTLSLTFKGFNYVSYYNGAYENADSLSALAGTGANAVALTTEYGIDVAHADVYTDPNYSDSLTALGNAISQAKGLGLSVMVRPLIDFLDPTRIGQNQVGDWRSYFNPSNPAAFFASYKSMIVAEAEVAAAHGADSLCIGAEIDQLTGPQYLPYWTDIIASVRAVFSGALTYSADWNDAASPWAGHNGLTAGTGNLATQVSFWNQLDSVGIDAYPALSDVANPTEADLVAGWTQVPTDPGTLAVTGNQSLISYFQEVAAQTGKPLQLTELGYESATDAASQPAGSSTNVFDPSLQAKLYQAFFDAWGQNGNGALNGVYFWNWDPNASEVGPGNGANFSPQGLAAENVVKTNFATQDTTPPAAPTIAAPALGSIVATNEPTISGMGEAGATATITIDGARAGTVLTDSTGNWSFTLATALVDGPHTVTATETDAANNVSLASAADLFTVDTSPPALAFGSVAFTDTGVSGDHITNNGAVTLSGTVSDNIGPTQVEVFDGGTDLGAATVSGGVWTLSASLGTGTHDAFSAVATDAAGNTMLATNPTRVTVDLIPPAITFRSVAFTDTGVSGDGITNNGVVTLSGTVSNNIGPTKVEVFDGGTDLGAATVSGGVWTLSASLGAGRHNAFSAVATDAAGNTKVATNSTSVTVDTSPPALAFGSVAFTDTGVSGDGITNNGVVTLSGTVSDNIGPTQVEVFDGGTDLGAATVSGGAWTLSASLGMGTHDAFSAVATDAAGNTALATNPTRVTVDFIPPAITFRSVAFTDTGVSGDHITNNGVVTLSGTVSDNIGPTQVEVFDGGTDLGAATVSGGVWTLSASLGTGPHDAFSAVATDAAGNTTLATNPTRVTVDLIPPAITFWSVAFIDTGVPDDGITTSGAVTLSGTVSNNIGPVKVEVFDGGTDLGAATVSGGAWTLSTSLGAGPHDAFSAVATDAAGNTAVATNPTRVTIDLVPPAIVFATVAFADTGVPGDGITNNGVVTLSGTVSDNIGPTQVEVFDGGTDLGAATVSGGTWSLSTILGVGPHDAFSAVATDAAGNTMVATNSTSVTVDPIPPMIAFNAVAFTDTGVPGDGITNTGAVTLSGTVSDAIGVAQVEVFDGGTDLGAATVSGGTWSLSTILGAGPHDAFSAVATDAAGNSARATNASSVTVDTTVPSLGMDPAVTFATATRVTLTGTVSDAIGVSRVEFFEGSKDLGAATLGPGGTFSFTHNFGAGFHTGLQVVATDNAGNSTTIPTDFDLTTGLKNASYASQIDNYDSSGNYLGSSEFTKTGQLYLGSSFSTLANGDQATLYTGGSFFDPLNYYAYKDVGTPDGTLATEILYNNDGGHVITGYQDGLTIKSMHRDSMTGGGANETFVFNAHFGRDLITDFQVGGNGRDILSLSKSDFSSIAEIIRNTQNKGHDVVIHVTGSDMITLEHVTKAELKANLGDLRLHA